MIEICLQGQQVGQAFLPGTGGYFVPTVANPQRFFNAQQMQQIRAQPRWNNAGQVRQPVQTGAAGMCDGNYAYN